jgi:glucose-1-phosphate cytidylyltransferase
MRAVILAGGLGTRISEESHLRPKPMIEIGGKPILWHIMKTYSAHGVNEFIVCCGYKGYLIKEYFANYFLHTSDVTFDIAANSRQVHQNGAEPWKVTLVDTGESTMTGGRLKAVARYLGDDDFCFTYGDGLAALDIGRLVRHHRAAGKLATVTAVRQPARYGLLELQGDNVVGFAEKPATGDAWVNGGFFVLSPKVLDYIEGPQTAWEREPLERLTAQGQLSAYAHEGFWQPMDTMRDKLHLEELWQSGNAPWKAWS